MLKENLLPGMKVAMRKAQNRMIYDNYTKEELNAEFKKQPYWIARVLERPHDEINEALKHGKDPKSFCVIANEDRSKGDYREGNYAHADILEPYDLAINKQNTKGGNE